MQTKDLLDQVLAESFGDFSIPEKSEGFDEIKFEWQNEAKSGDYLNTWRKQKKISSRMDHLQVGEWFKTTSVAFQKQIDEWQAKQKAKPKSAAKPKKAEGEDAEEEESKPDVDIFEVKDVCDIGNGVALFSEFAFEDWTILSLRAELFLLMEGFKKDANDDERVGIHESLFQHYYNKYFKRGFNPKLYGKDNLKEVISDFVKDTVKIDETNGVLGCSLAEDADRDISYFLKLQEESRRERQRRIDAGDDSVRIDFVVLKNQIEQEKQRGLKAEADKKRAEAAKEAARNQQAGKGAAASQPVKWGATQETPKATWNSNAGASRYGAAKGGSKGYESKPYEVKGAKGGAKGKW